MPTRVAPALSLSSLMLLLAAVQAQPPRWMTTPPEPLVLAPEPPPAPAPPPLPPKPRKVPPILAVDNRIRNRVNGLKPAIKKRLAHVARKLPQRVRILVTSAYRTRQEQANLRPTFGVKAKPGRSAHEDGRAIDVNVLIDGQRISPKRNHAVIGKIMAEAGFRYLGHHDPVHFSVPKHEIGSVVAETPQLDVMTIDELEETRAEIRAYSQAVKQRAAFEELAAGQVVSDPSASEPSSGAPEVTGVGPASELPAP